MLLFINIKQGVLTLKSLYEPVLTVFGKHNFTTNNPFKTVSEIPSYIVISIDLWMRLILLFRGIREQEQESPPVVLLDESKIWFCLSVKMLNEYYNTIKI